jgi:hypothetical protein
MTTSSFPGEKPTRFLPSECGLSESVQQFGCPMMDNTPWDQSPCGQFFKSPDGIETAAFWLPCVSGAAGEMILPDTCESCESRRTPDPA